MCLSVHCVCLFALSRLNRWTYGPKIWHAHLGPTYLGRVRRSRSEVKVTKVKNVKIPVFCLISEKARAKVKGQGSRSRSQGQGQSYLGITVPHASTRWMYNTRAFSLSIHMYSGQRKKLNGPAGAKYFFPVERGKLFLAPLYYGRSYPVYALVTR